MNVMLLAAGEGTRLRPHTLVLPKPAIPFLNIPLVCYPLSFLETAGVDKLVVNTFHLPQKMQATIESIQGRPKDLHFVNEDKEILGSGGGLKNAEKFFIGGGDFVMMNADEIIIPEDIHALPQALADHKKESALATLLVMDYPGVGSKFGGVWCKGSQVLGFGKEKVPGSDRAWHFVGAQILSERVFKYIPAAGPSNILYDALKDAIAAGEKVRIQSLSCSWFETGNPQDFLEATEHCIQALHTKNKVGQYLESVIQKFSDQKNELLSQENSLTLKSKSAQVSPAAQIEGFVTMASQVVVPAGCRLKNVCVGPNVQLAEQSYENQIIL